MPRRNASAAVTKFLGGNFGGWKGAQPAAPPGVIRARIAPDIADWLPFDGGPGTTYVCKAGGVLYGVNQQQFAAPTLQVFDPDGPTWTHFANFPAGLLAEESPLLYLVNNPLISDGTDIFVVSIRADTTAGFRLSRLWKYDIGGSSWTQLTDPPGGNGAQADGYIGYANGGIFLIGGRNPAHSSRVTTNSRYDIAGNSWSTKTALPAAATIGSSSFECPTWDDDLIYLYGATTPTYSATVRVYSESGNSWSTRANVPENGVIALVDKLDDDRAVLMVPSSTEHHVWLYDQDADTYTQYGPPVPHADTGMGGFQLQGGGAIGQKAYIDSIGDGGWYNVADF